MAASLDAVYARSHPERTDAVSSGLDAVRFPGAEGAANARRARADALHQLRRQIRAELKAVHRRREALAPNGAPAADAEKAELLRAEAVLYERHAAVYEDLCTAEPELADEHRADSEQATRHAASCREHADLLTGLAGA